MIAHWIGLLLLSGAWLFLEPVFVPEAEWIAGLALLAAGLALLCLSSRRSWKEALRLVALILALQFLALEFLLPVAASHHDLPGLSPLLLIIGRTLGIPMAVDNGTLFIRTEEDVLPFVTNWEKVGLVLPVSLLIAMTMAAIAFENHALRGARRWLCVVAALLGYTLVRYLVLCGWLIEFGDPKNPDGSERFTLFTSAWVTLATYLPFCLLAARLRLWNLDLRPASAQESQPRPGRGLFAYGAVAAAVAFALLSSRLCLPGPAKAGRVLVDDTHSGIWEPSVPKLDTRGFGAKFLYNDSSLIEYLRCYYSVNINLDQPINEETLREVDVLVIKTPTRRFARAEISSILAFVRRGGGLLLIGDHTNLLGMSSFLNEIASCCGIQFCFDASNAYSSGYFSSFRPPWIFAHPVVQGLPQVNFMTTCTLKPGRDAELIMVGRDLISDPIDYSKPSFFGALNPSTRNGFGLFPLAVAAREGLGRVAAFADSTTMSNFAVFKDGTAQFYLRLIGYLNQTNRDGRAIKWTLAGAALLCAGAALVSMRDRKRELVWSYLVFGSVIGYLLAGAGLRLWNGRAFPTPPQIRSCPRVSYLVGPDFSYFTPAAIGPCFWPIDRSFDAVFVMPQRFGVFPAFTPLSELNREHAAWVVALNPRESFDAGQLKKLKDFVTNGGRLLVLEDPACQHVLVKALTKGSGTAEPLFTRQITASLQETNPGPTSLANPKTLPNALEMTNAAARLNAGLDTNAALQVSLPADQVKPVQFDYAAWKVGSGTLYVLSNSVVFSRMWLGSVMAEPNQAQRHLYEIASQVFGEFLGPVGRPD